MEYRILKARLGKASKTLVILLYSQIFEFSAYGILDLAKLEKENAVAIQHLVDLKTHSTITEMVAPISVQHQAFMDLSEQVDKLSLYIKHNIGDLKLVEQSIAESNSEIKAISEKKPTPEKEEALSQERSRLEIKEDVKTRIEGILISDEKELKRLLKQLLDLNEQLKSSSTGIADLPKNISNYLGGMCSGIFNTVFSRATVKPEDSNGTALLNAAKEGDIEKIKELLGKGVEINSRDIYGMTPLMMATRGKHSNAIKLLLERGARIDLSNKENQTLFAIAEESELPEKEILFFPYLHNLDHIKPVYAETGIPLLSEKTPVEYEANEIRKDLFRESVWFSGFSDTPSSSQSVPLKTLINSSDRPEKNRDVLVESIATTLQKAVGGEVSEATRRLALRYLTSAVGQITLVGYLRSDGESMYTPGNLRWTDVDLRRKKITKYITYLGLGSGALKGVPLLGRTEIDMSSLSSSGKANLELIPLTDDLTAYSHMIDLFKSQKPAPVVDREEWSK